jgi:multiple sugar transport system permease protein/putative aldouronate transport system permease protein
MNKMKKNSLGMSDKSFNILLLIIVTLFLIVVLYPLVYVVSSSFSSGRAVSDGRVLLWPVDFSIEGYKLVFNNQEIWRGYANTMFYVVGRTSINLVCTTLVAYVLSRKTFQGRKFFNLVYLITMWFGGGMIPTYIMFSDFNMTNSRWGYLFMSIVSVGNMVLLRTYFRSSIPEDLLEAAQIDGITDFGYLVRVALPLAKPVLAVVTLYEIVGEWNSYFGPMIYLRSQEIQPLQLVLRRILTTAEMNTSMLSDASLQNELAQMGDVMKYALIVVSAGPMMCLFPFVQKFFTKGVMIGSLKG